MCQKLHEIPAEKKKTLQHVYLLISLNCDLGQVVGYKLLTY